MLSVAIVNFSNEISNQTVDVHNTSTVLPPANLHGYCIILQPPRFFSAANLHGFTTVKPPRLCDRCGGRRLDR